VLHQSWGSRADSAMLVTLSLEEPMRWGRLRPEGAGPGPRFGASRAADPVHRRLLVHGGSWYRMNGMIAEFHPLFDTWSYSLDEGRWTRIETTGTPSYGSDLPEHAYESDHDRWVFGTRITHCDSLRVLDLASGVWNAVPATALEGAHTVWVHDPARDRILTFDDDASEGGNPLRTLQLDPHLIWAEAPLADTPPPPSRYWPSFVIDAARDRAVLVGEDPSLSFIDEVPAGYPATDAWLLSLSRDGDIGLAIPAGRLTLSPNPADRTTRATFRLARTQEVTFELFDLTGRLVHRSPLGTLSAGAHVRPVDLGGAWPSGVYFARLRLAEGEVGARIAIVH
jgi:hypothetical protein